MAVDCNAVYLMAHHEASDQRRPGKQHAGAWRRMAKYKVDIWSKVKAHQEVPEDPATHPERLVVLNDRGDTRAKTAVEWHGLNDSDVGVDASGAGRAAIFTREAGWMLSAYPPPKTEGVEYARDPRARKVVAKPLHAHRWA